MPPCPCQIKISWIFVYKYNHLPRNSKLLLNIPQPHKQRLRSLATLLSSISINYEGMNNELQSNTNVPSQSITCLTAFLIFNSGQPHIYQQKKKLWSAVSVTGSNMGKTINKFGVCLVFGSELCVICLIKKSVKICQSFHFIINVKKNKIH